MNYFLVFRSSILRFETNCWHFREPKASMEGRGKQNSRETKGDLGKTIRMTRAQYPGANPGWVFTKLLQFICKPFI